MGALGSGPNVSTGQRSGAVRVWPGGTRPGSTPSGSRLESAGVVIELWAGDREGPALGEALPVDRAGDLRGVPGARLEGPFGHQRPPRLGQRLARRQRVAGYLQSLGVE